MKKLLIGLALLGSFSSFAFDQISDLYIYDTGSVLKPNLSLFNKFPIDAKTVEKKLKSDGHHSNIECEIYDGEGMGIFGDTYGIRCTGKKVSKLNEAACEALSESLGDKKLSMTQLDAVELTIESLCN